MVGIQHSVLSASVLKPPPHPRTASSLDMPFIFPLCRLSILAPPVAAPVRRAPVLHVECEGGQVVADHFHKLLQTDFVVPVRVALLQYVCEGGLHTYWHIRIDWDVLECVGIYWEHGTYGIVRRSFRAPLTHPRIHSPSLSFSLSLPLSLSLSVSSLNAHLEYVPPSTPPRAPWSNHPSSATLCSIRQGD